MGSQYNDYTWAVVDVGVTNSDPSKTISVWIGNFKFSNATGYTYDAGARVPLISNLMGVIFCRMIKDAVFLYLQSPKMIKI